MRKHDSLRAALLPLVPDAVRDPERLTVFVDKGEIAARMGGGWEYRYTILLYLIGFAGDEDVVFGALLDWIAVHQPDLLQAYPVNDAAIGFTAAIQDDRSADIEIRVAVRETVRRIVGAGGAVSYQHQAELPLDRGVGNPAVDALLAQLGVPDGQLLP